VAGIAGLALGAAADHANLVFEGLENFQGTGLGNVNTVLTLQSPGSSNTESGGVTPAGTPGDTVGVNSLRTISSSGAASASQLRIVLNAAEPQNGLQGITVSALTLNIYAPTGTGTTPLFSASLATPVNIPDTLPGIGNSGFSFALDSTEAAQAQAAIFSSAGFGGDRVGLMATLTNAEGGPDTFFLSNRIATPEPSTWAMVALGIAGLGWLQRRRHTGQASA